MSWIGLDAIQTLNCTQLLITGDRMCTHPSIPVCIHASKHACGTHRLCDLQSELDCLCIRGADEREEGRQAASIY